MAAAGLPPTLLFAKMANLYEIEIAGATIGFVHVFYTWVGLAILAGIGYLVKKNVRMVPGKLQSFFEFLVDTLETFIVSNIGEKGRRFVPLLCGIFIFILTMNLIGLVPGCDAPTANLNTTAAMALFVFVYYNVIGIKTHGSHYIQHFTGTNKALVPLMFPLEIISHVARPLSLTLRLFGNIFGEEITLVIFFSFGAAISVGALVGTVPLYFLFMLAKTLQAFIFFILTMTYIKGALEHAH